MTTFPASCAFPVRVAAIDVGATKIAGGVVVYADPASAPVVEGRRSVPTNAKQGGAGVLAAVCALAQDLVADAGGPGSVAGVGVGTAGRVDAATGAIAFANDLMPGWTGQPLGQQLREACGVPSAVLGDVQAYAMGEARWGAARGAQTCLMVAAGTGVGGAVVAHGRVVKGSHGFAGEIGHIASAQAVGIPCVCGGSGHLESVAAGSGIEARYFEATDEHASGAEIARRANEDHERAARRVIMQAGRALGEAIASVTSVLDPEVVVLAGSVTKAGAEWRAEVDAGFRAQIPAAHHSMPIVPAELGDNAPLVGAAENLLDTLAADENAA